MEQSIYDQMEICGNVLDKCCTISDEIKITKLWKERGMPYLSNHTDSCIYFLGRIVDLFYEIGSIDPRLMVLKYIQTYRVPFKYEDCNITAKKQTDKEANENAEEFATFFDKAVEVFMKKTSSADRAIDTKEMTHDQYTKERHWGIHMHPEDQVFYMNNKDLAQDFIEDTLVHKHMTCKAEDSFFSKDFIVINQEKATFCYDIYEKILYFGNERFRNVIKGAKAGMSQFSKFKGTFYCSLCDAHQQKYIDIKDRAFVMSNDFCKIILKKNSGLIKTLHIMIIEYADMLLQLVSCYESNAEYFSFPFQNFLAKYKRRIPLIQECYENIENENFMEHCWFICQQYKITNISPFFEGDLQLYKRIYLALYSFIRKVKISQDSSENDLTLDDTAENVDGLLIEPLNPSHTISNKYYIDDKDRLVLLGVLNTYPKLDKGGLDEAIKEFKFLGNTSGIEFVQKLQKKFFHQEYQKEKILQDLIKKAEQMIVDKRIAEEEKKKKELEEMGQADSDEMKMEEELHFQEIKNKHFGVYEDSDYDTQNHANSYKSNMDNLRPIRILISGLKYAIEKVKKRKSRKLLETQNTSDDDNDDSDDNTNSQTDSQTDSQNDTNNDQQDDHKNNDQSKNNPKFDGDDFEHHLGPHHIDSNILEDFFDDNEKSTEEVSDDIHVVSHLKIETANEIYHKNVNMFDLQGFKVKFKEEGMNPINHIDLIDFSKDLTHIIKSKFSKSEPIENEIIRLYFQIPAKEINQYNYLAREEIFSPAKIKEVTSKFYEALEKLEASTNPEEKAENQRIVNQILEDHKIQIKQQQEINEANLQKEEYLKLKKEKERNQKSEINNHIDEKHFKSLFYDMWEYFIEMFGT